MLKNKPFIDKTIQLMKQDNDHVQEFATRNKASPLEVWSEFKPYSEKAFNNIYQLKIDGVKLKFRYTTLTINGRHKSK